MKKVFKQATVLLLAVAMITPFILPLKTEAATNQVQVSKETYGIVLSGAKAFLCNDVPLDGKVGTEMYLTYTVGQVDSCEAIQNGVGGNPSATADYPYRNGGFLYFKNGDTKYLLQPETTYFMKFVITEKGFDYTIGWAKDDKSGELYFQNEVGEASSPMNYMGLWIDGGSTKIKLNDVHCYDREGNDLGLSGSGVQVMPQYAKPFAKATQVKHSYTVTAENQVNVQIYNEKKTDSDIIYFEYKVKSSASKIYQSGVKMNNKEPSTPYGNGQYVYELLSMKEPGNGFMLIPGAEYWIKCEDTHSDKGWTALVQRTYKGKTEWFRLSGAGKKHDEHVGFTSLFFGEGADFPATFVLTELKCYDAEYQNLGIATNRGNGILVEHEGELLDYSGCERIFYSNKTEVLIAIYPDQTLKFTKAGKTTSGTYYIDDSKPKELNINIGKETSKYTYYYSYLLDDDGNRYDSLLNYVVHFVPGNGEENFEQNFSMEDGYIISKPEDPTMKDDKFLYWCTRDGKEYDFTKLVTESATLYAKWEKGGIRTYETLENGMNDIDFSPHIAITISVVIIAVTVVGSVVIIKRRRKHAD